MWFHEHKSFDIWSLKELINYYEHFKILERTKLFVANGWQSLSWTITSTISNVNTLYTRFQYPMSSSVPRQFLKLWQNNAPNNKIICIFIQP
jgi:hypothetical protein